MADAAGPYPVRLRHRMPGRTRISLTEPLPSAEQLESLADQLAALAGVHAVDIRLQTGSIVIRHERDCDPVAAASEGGLVDILPEPPPEPFDAPSEIIKGFGKFDAYLSRVSEGRLDAWGLAFTGLVAAGVVQIARGKMLSPATALFGQAASLAMARPLRKFVQ